MIKIAICDDEKVIREHLAELVEKQGANCQIELFATGDNLLAGEKHYDMIFLDIQMVGLNGIETARAIREYDEQAVIIFVTVVKEYVFEAFDVGAFHYLIKPIREEKFKEVFTNALRSVKRWQSKAAEPTLFVKGTKRGVLLKQKEILYVENKANKVVIHTIKEEIEAWYALKKLEEELGSGFYRCHRAYIVNMGHISGYTNDMIDMDNGDRIYLTKGKYPEFVKIYMRYIDDRGAADDW